MDEDQLADLQRINWLCQGNTEAVQFCSMLWDMVATYDDIIDADNPSHSELHVHAMMYSALFGLPYNKFYAANFALLNPLMMNAVANWRIANEVERQYRILPVEERASKVADLHFSFIIRSSYIDILRMVAFIVGGDAHSIQAGIELRRYVHAEGLDSYLTEMQGE